jgi:hypothetical protein
MDVKFNGITDTCTQFLKAHLVSYCNYSTD